MNRVRTIAGCHGGTRRPLPTRESGAMEEQHHPRYAVKAPVKRAAAPAKLPLPLATTLAKTRMLSKRPRGPCYYQATPHSLCDICCIIKRHLEDYLRHIEGLKAGVRLSQTPI